MCQCRTTGDGRVIVCDPCAAAILETLDDLLPGQPMNELPELAAGTYNGLKTLVNHWLDNVAQGQQSPGGAQ